MKRMLKKIVLYSFLVFTSTLLVLQIPSVNTRVLQGIVNIVTPSDLRIRLKGIRGTFPFNLTIEKIKFKDKTQQWLEIQNVSFDWQGVDILYGNIHFSEVNADKIIYLVKPNMAKSPEPMKLPRLNIDSLKIKALEIPGLYQGNFGIQAKIQSPISTHHIVEAGLSFSGDYSGTDTIIYEQMGINYTLKTTINRPIVDFASLSPEFIKSSSGKVKLAVNISGDTNFLGAVGKAELNIDGFRCSQSQINNILGSNPNVIFEGEADDANNFKKAQLRLGLNDRSAVINIHPRANILEIKGNLKSQDYQGQLSGEIRDHNHIDLKLTGSGGQVAITYNMELSEIDSVTVNFNQLSPITTYFFWPVWGEVKLTGAWQGRSKKINAIAKDISFNNRSTLFKSVQIDFLEKNNLYNLEAKAETSDIKLKLEGSASQDLKHIIVTTLYAKPIFDKSRLLENKTPIVIQAYQSGYKIQDTSLALLDGGLSFKNFVLSAAPTGSIHLEGFDAKFLNVLIDGTQWQGTLQGDLVFGGKNLYQVNLAIKDLGLESGLRKREKLLNATIQLIHDGSKLLGEFSYTDTVGSKLDGILKSQTTHFIPQLSDPILSSLTGTINLSALNTIIWWGDRLKGKLTVSLKGEGVLSSPKISGKFDLVGGLYENSTLGTLLRDIKGQATISSGILKLISLEGRDYNKGTFGMKGIINFDDFSSPKVDANLLLKKIMVANSHEAIIEVSGKLGFSTPKPHHHMISGNILVDSALINLNQVSSEPKTIRIFRTIDELERKKAKKINEMLTQLDLKIDIPRKLLVQGYGLRSEWQGQMTLTGPVNIPNIKGGINSLKGRFDISSKRLTLAPSSVTFETQHGQLMPILDIKATKTVREFETFISVKGPADEPKIDFISIPAQSTENVIALILFDKPLSEVSVAQSLQLATTLAAVKAGKFTGGALDSINQLLGVDDISLNKQENLDGFEDDNAQYAVSIGKQLSEKVFVGLEQGLQQETGSKVKAKVDVTKSTKLEAEVGTQNTAVGYGIEFRY